MTNWQLTVRVAQGPPIVQKLIDLARRRPLMGGKGGLIVARFKYGTEQEARDALKRVEDAGLDASCSVRFFETTPALCDVEGEEISLDEWEELEEEQRREKVIHAIALRNAAGRMEDTP